VAEDFNPDVNRKVCAKCGASLGSNSRRGFCGRCIFAELMAIGDESETAGSSDDQSQAAPTAALPDAKEADSRRFGDYELMEELGRGGMGIVYRARQRSVRRQVALKLLHFGPMAGEETVKRLRMEATAAGCLRHPHIVAIHEVGIHQDQHYLAMDYVAGPNLSNLAANQPWPAQRAARLVKTVAEAIQYAHDQGILHRDLKPSNILVDGDDQPRITDFGLAKRFSLSGENKRDQEARSSLPDTPSSHPSPPLGEKVPGGRMRGCSPEGDAQIWDEFHSLTVTGQVLGSPNYMPPEQASATKGKIGRHSDVYSLGAVIYHLLTGRPPFVGETMTATLHHVLEIEVASPRLLNPRVPVDLETICLKCLEKEPQRRYATARELAEELGRFLNGEPILARPISGAQRVWRWCRRKPVLASLIFANLALLLTVAIGSPIALFRIDRERVVAQRNSYIANMTVAQQAWEQNNIGRLRQSLEETATYPDRGFEWYFWQRRTHLELKTLRPGLRPGHLLGLSFSPDGQRVVVSSWNEPPKVLESASGKELFTLKGHNAAVLSVAFSPDGSRIVTGSDSPKGRPLVPGSDDFTAKVWEAATGRELLTLKGHSERIWSVAFSPDGQRIVTGSHDHTAKVWEAASGKELITFTGHSNDLWSVAFSPDGRRIVSGSVDTTAKVWEAASGRELLTLKGHTGQIRSVAFSPDGQRIVTGSADKTAKVWDAASGQELLSLKGHSDEISSVAVSRDGRRIVTGSWDQTAKVWEAASGKELFTLKGHIDKLGPVSFSPDDQRIVTGSWDETAKVWDAAGSRESLALIGHSGWVYSVSFSSDGQWIATCGSDRTAKVWEASSGQELLTLKGHGDEFSSVAFSPDKQRIVTGSTDKTAKVWEAASGQELFTLKGHLAPVFHVAFSPDGRWMATGSQDQTAKVWEAAGGKEVLTLMGHSDEVTSVAFSPDGQRIVTTSGDQTAKVWEAASGKELLTLKGHSRGVWFASFSSDGQRIVTGSMDQTAKVWDAASGQELFTLKGHSAPITRAIFSPNGQRVVTSSDDMTAKVWEAKSGRELLTLKGHNAEVRSVAVSPDGRRIVTSSADQTAKVWQAASPEEVARWREEERNDGK
jgi:WD40 repeat protein/serine/threonine protein kinase